MTLFVDASALVAIINDEEDGRPFEAQVNASDKRLTNAVALWEAALAVARLGETDPETGWREVERYRASFDLIVVPIGTAEAVEAVRAQRSYGRGSGSRARLNMGDCFAYACAKTNNARLLYKGDDFSHTDLA